MFKFKRYAIWDPKHKRYFVPGSDHFVRGGLKGKNFIASTHEFEGDEAGKG